MNDDKQRKINAYKKTLDTSSAADGGDDNWLLRLAASQKAEAATGPKQSGGGADSGSKPPANTAGRTGGNGRDLPSAPANPVSFSEKAHLFAKIPAQTGENGASNNANNEKDSKYRRVAKFLILLGAEQASKVLSNLDETQIEQISAEIATIKTIAKEEASEIFAEFQGIIASSYGLGSSTGGLDQARNLLYAAFGPEKGEAFLRRSVPAATETSFAFLEDFSGEQIAMLLHTESPATGAMILSRIDPKMSAAALKSSDPIWRLETVRRIGHLQQISPEVLEQVAMALRDKARKIGSAATSDVDGMGALAAILKHADISFGDKILKDLSDEDPDLSRNLKERLYTLDDVVKAEDKPIQEKLHSMGIHDIAILIKGRNEEFSNKVLSNISAGRRSEVREELNFMGPITKKDSDAALKLFMEWFRNEREEGHILMLGDEDLVQ
jgi:flagellar motor switch protein FliG